MEYIELYRRNDQSALSVQVLHCTIPYQLDGLCSKSTVAVEFPSLISRWVVCYRYPVFFSSFGPSKQSKQGSIAVPLPLLLLEDTDQCPMQPSLGVTKVRKRKFSTLALLLTSELQTYGTIKVLSVIYRQYALRSPRNL